MREYAALSAAVVNGALVLFLPAWLVGLTSILRAALPAQSSSVTVYARTSSTVEVAIQASLIGLLVTMPLAAVAAWRTWVHATQWLQQRRTWRGVVEATALGALFVTVMLGSAALRASALGAGSFAAIPAIALYAAIGALVGLLVGLMLQLMAMAVLTLAVRSAAPNRPLD